MAFILFALITTVVIVSLIVGAKRYPKLVLSVLVILTIYATFMNNLNDKKDSVTEKTNISTPEPTINIELTEEQFKASCNYLNYEDILRNPSNYKMVNCKIDGRVSQVIEGWFGSYSIFVKDNNGNIWGCTYSYKDGESQLLEDDKVTVYGVCNETTNTETVLGKQVTMPYIELKYIR